MSVNLAEKANSLPQLPGVYIMHDSAGEVIYVGKAKKLKNRVTSYFRGSHLPKVAAMVEKVADFEFVVVSSEFEALVLENSLIKRHRPHYNILLKDDKGYPYIHLNTAAEYPRFSVVSKKTESGLCFGPFGGRNVTHEIIRTVQRCLRLPDCTLRFPRDIGKYRPCLNYQMGVCAGYCRSEASAEDFRKSISQAIRLLEGNTAELKREIRAEMTSASEELRFEAAAELRDRLRAIEQLENTQNVVSTIFSDTDVFGFYRGAKSAFSVLHYHQGSLTGKDFEITEEPVETDADAVSAFVRQYYSARGVFPKTVLLPAFVEDGTALGMYLSEQHGKKVHVLCPVKGDRAHLTDTAAVNAREEAERITSERERHSAVLQMLQKQLALPSIPQRIEAFDISNTGSAGIVAAMTVFVDGKPKRSDYRTFKMRTVETQDDFASMREAVQRRFLHAIQGHTGFEELPDLLLIDGGTGQVSAAEEALRSLSISLPVFGMVKNAKHRTRALVNGAGEELSISGVQALFVLIGTIQEETHRCAIGFHRRTRAASIGSTLENIPGIGPKRRAQLLNRFGSVRGVSAADEASLRSVLPADAAHAVYSHYHPKEDPPCVSSPEQPAEEN